MPRPFSEDKKQQWNENILKQRESGLSVAVWCHENNFNTHTFGYWQKKLFPKILDSSAFAEIKDRKDSENFIGKGAGITMEYQGVRIHLDKQFDLSVLKQCLEILRGAVC